MLRTEDGTVGDMSVVKAEMHKGDYDKALNHVEPVKSKGYLPKALLASVTRKVALSYAIFT